MRPTTGGGAGAGPAHRVERLNPWIAGLASVVLHALALWLALQSSPVVTAAGSAAGGGRVAVEYIGDGTPDPALSVPPPRPAPPRAAPPAAASQVRATEVPIADAPLVLAPAPDAAERPVPPSPAAPQPQVAAPSPPATQAPSPRRGRTWGQPPGMQAVDTAPVNAGPAAVATVGTGRRYAASASEANLEVGGYQVIYDLRAEPRLRTWRNEGMTELFLPLPGTRQLMVCPLETALRRGSGPCRLVDPDDPELASIGDAREVLDMNQVYRRGELVWRGPRPYR